MLALGSVRWRKVWRDLREHRVRSLLVVLSIAVGVMAVGTIAGANALLERNLARWLRRDEAVVGEPVHDRPVRPGPRRRRAPDARRRRGRGPPERHGPDGHGPRRDGRARSSPRSPTSTAQPMDLVTPGVRHVAAEARRDRVRAVEPDGRPTSRTAARSRSSSAPTRRRRCVTGGLRPRARRGAGLLLRPADRLRHVRHPRGPRLRRLVRTSCGSASRTRTGRATRPARSRPRSATGSRRPARRSRSSRSRRPASTRPRTSSTRCS